MEISGSVTLNGLTDKQLVTVLEAKIRHEGAIFFNPQQIQQQARAKPGTNVQFMVNNNVVVSWNTDVGYRATLELLAELAGHQIVAKQAA